MNEAALLAACDAAPNDPVPRLVLADWLEEAGTPGRAVVARLVRQSVVALRAGTPAAQGVLTRLRNRLSKTHPSAVAWFEWWFEPTVLHIVQLHNALDRRRLARFVVRCLHETPSRLGGVVMDRFRAVGLADFRLLERIAQGDDVTNADIQPAPLGGLPTTYIASVTSLFGMGDVAEAVRAAVLALTNPQTMPHAPGWAAVTAASACATAFADDWAQQAPARELHRRLLHECVPCPFDPEGDG